MDYFCYCILKFFSANSKTYQAFTFYTVQSNTRFE